MKFHVLREHFGDRMYKRGDVREAQESTVKHLLNKGILSKTAPKSKADKPLKNKAAD